MKHPIYLDYNATTPIDPKVADEMLPFVQTFYGNPSSSHSLGNACKQAVIQAREQVASLINADPFEIVFTSGGTESNNHAIQGIANANRNKGNHIITSVIEHPAVSNVCNYLTESGYEISRLPVNNLGLIDPKDVAEAIRPGTMLITIMHANNEVGSIQPIREIGKIARQNNISFHTDAAQSVGKIETDVNHLGVDLLSIAGHKLYAPKGIGALYIRKGTAIKNLMYGAGQEMGYRPGTENVIQIVGLGKACEIAKHNFADNVEIMLSTKERLLKGLKRELGSRIHVNGDPAGTLPNTLSVAIESIEAHRLVSGLGNDLCISTGSACHADAIEVSPVLKAMNLKLKIAAGTVRISTGKFTTLEEIDQAVSLIAKAVRNTD